MAIAPADPAASSPHQAPVPGPGGEGDLELVACLERELGRLLPAEGGTAIGPPAHHALLPAGKLLRPLLVVRSALAVGGVVERVVPAAVGLECAHAGSLVHDDLIDRDAFRRGRAAVHERFGMGAAIVTGNALFFIWFEALAECASRGVPNARIVAAARVQARAGREVCEGAARELAQAGDLDTTVADYLEMVRLKTAVLMSAACRIGATLAGATAPRIAALAAYGEAFGTAFQIRDDLLPYTADPHLAGKPLGSDVRNLRPTLPVLLARDRGTPIQRSELRRAFTSRSVLQRHAIVREMIESTGAAAAAAGTAEEHADQARAHLARLPDSPHREFLAALIGTTTASNFPSPLPDTSAGSTPS